MSRADGDNNTASGRETVTWEGTSHGLPRTCFVQTPPLPATVDRLMAIPSSGTLLQGAVSLLQALLLDRRYFWALAGLALVADVVLTQLVIRFVGFTEIDYETYIEHITLFVKGERDYSQITGPSGPLVYPAGHVWIHWVLRHVTADQTTGAILVRTAQQIYGALYLWTLLVSCQVYQQAGGMPNYVILPLILSKRLHSIFVLRLFNDCWAVAIMMTAIVAYQKRWLKVGTGLYALALSVKMNILLYLPGILVILVQTAGLLAGLGHIALVIGIQGLLALPFLNTHPKEYLSNAFNLSRVFLYKWTVNWRFVPEEVFLSTGFAKCLLALHVFLLLVFGFKWCQPDGGLFPVIRRSLFRPTEGSGVAPMNPDRIATILFTSNLLGIIVARSLHYQFYSWYAQQLPFLVWHTKYPTPVRLVLLLAIEYAWNVFPSTDLSSGILLVCNTAILAGVYFGYPHGRITAPPEKKET